MMLFFLSSWMHDFTLMSIWSAFGSAMCCRCWGGGGGAHIFSSFSLSPQMYGVYSVPRNSEVSESSVATVPLDIAVWSPVLGESRKAGIKGG